MLGRGRQAPALPAPLPDWPSYRQVRRFCRAVVRATGATAPPAPETLCAAVGDLRGRPITIEYRAMPPGLFGLSFSLERRPADVIVVAANTSRTHQEHILLHELGHVLAGHLDDEPGATTAGHADGSADRGEDDDPGERAREREWVAESIATVLAERALLYSRRFGEVPTDPASRALDEALRSGGGWV